ncbi:SpaA isopeptide-forming pilin-related protein [Butyrivibrio sp. MB2005]|uniref:SpaA isopeptide-forming pilin-related protein n=1 Tax=Butyrivibrio sp. MB2005 TaxID=1280678 RepID=UPI0004241272|nr:SpaA isopeptide-forming pilin-related protein [Butyrivibrio sp. MB2005]
MARKNSGQRKAEEYIKRHAFARRWGSVMLVMAMLVTTVTLYAMNRAASAVTEEGADEIGMILENDDLEMAGLNSDGGEEETVEDTEETSDSEDEYTEEASEDEESSDDTYEEEEYTEETSEANYEDNSDESNEDASEEEASTEDSDDAAEDFSEEAEEGTSDDSENAEGSEDSEESFDEELNEETLAGALEDELMQDVVLTVSYVDGEGELIVDEAGEALADEKKISLMDSMIFEDDARTIDGYNFKEVIYEYYDEDKEETEKIAIEKITVMIYTASDDNGYKYYEVVPKDDPETEEDESEDVMEIKLDTNLTFVYEKVEEEVSEEEEQTEESGSEENTESSENSENTENSDNDSETGKSDKSDKTTDAEVPESVNLAEYITETVIERENADGTWEVIDEKEIKIGDHLRITVNYVLPEKAAASDDIYYNVPEQYGNVISKEEKLKEGNGNYEVSEDNKIKINYSDEYKKVVTGESDDSDTTDENVTTDDATSGNTTSENATSDNTTSKKTTQTNKDLGKATGRDGKRAGSAFALSGAINYIFGGGFLKSFVITAHAADGQGTSGSVSVETIVDSTVTGSMVVNGATLTKRPSITYNSDGTVSYSGGVQIQSGAQVSSGDGILFRLSYYVPIGKVTEDNSITYELKKRGVVPDAFTTGPVYNNLNEEVGVFEIDTDGKTTITFFKEFAAKNKDQVIYGDFYFYATANAEGDQETTEKTYDFGDNFKFNITIIKNKTNDLTLDKKETKYEKADDGSALISYLITVTTNNGTGGDFYMNDWLEAYCKTQNGDVFSQEIADKINQSQETLVEFSVVKKDKNGNTSNLNLNPTDGSLEYDRTDNRGYKISGLEAGESYAITYTLRFSSDIVSPTAQTTVKNVCKVTFGEYNEERYAYANHTFEGKEPKVEKYGEKVKGQNSIKWTVKLNQNHQNLKDFVFTDAILRYYSQGWSKRDIPYTGVITVSAVNPDGTHSGATFTQNQTFTIPDGGYKFTVDDYNAYEFTYTYDFVSADLLYGSVYNEARIYLENSTIGNTAQSSVWAGGIKLIEKKAEGLEKDSNDNYKARWNITLHAPITRNAGKNLNEYFMLYENVIDSFEVFTDEDIRAFSTAFDAVYDGEFSIDKSEPATVNGISGYKKLSVKCKADLTKDISFSFTSTASIGDGKGTVIYNNRAAVYNLNTYGKDATQYFNPLVTKYDGENRSGDSEYEYYSKDLYKCGILTWIIRVMVPDSCNYENLYIIDEIPEGLNLISSGKYNDRQVNWLEVSSDDKFSNPVAFEGGSAVLDGVTYSQTTSGNKVIISFDPKQAAGRKVYFRIHAQIPSDYDYSDIQKAEFENVVVVSSDSNGEVELDRSSQKQFVTKTDTTVRKKGEYASGTTDTIEYTLDINENAADLLQEGDTLTLTDELSATCPTDFSMSLVPGSIHVYEVIRDAAQNETVKELVNGTDFTYTASMYDVVDIQYPKYHSYGTIVFKIPDKKFIRVKYRYMYSGDLSSYINLDNKAKLEGIVVENDNARHETSVQVKDAGARAQIKGIDLYKVDAENNGTLLQGAEFELSYWDTGKNDWTTENNPTFTSDADGHILISPLVYNRAYKLKETNAPKGYLLNETPIIFYIASSDTNTYRMEVPDDFTSKLNGVILTAGQPIYFPNTKEKTQITVNKTWVNPDSATKPGSITVKIGRRLGAETDSSTEGFYTVNIERRMPNGKLEQVKSFPSVAGGSILEYSFYTYKHPGYTSAATISINGQEVDYLDELDESGFQLITKKVTITGDTQIDIKDGWEVPKMGDAGNTTATIYPASTGSSDSEGTRAAKNASADEVQDFMEITLTEADHWTKTVTDLDRFCTKKVDGVDKRYQWLYFVSEVSNMYYEPSYSENNKTGITSGEITITNTRNQVQPYSLPSTGGSGRLPFTIGGIALVTLALVGEEIVRKKRRKYNK